MTYGLRFILYVTAISFIGICLSFELAVTPTSSRVFAVLPEASIGNSNRYTSFTWIETYNDFGEEYQFTLQVKGGASTYIGCLTKESQTSYQAKGRMDFSETTNFFRELEVRSHDWRNARGSSSPVTMILVSGNDSSKIFSPTDPTFITWVVSESVVGTCKNRVLAQVKRRRQ
jgi:hypothetical protein